MSEHKVAISTDFFSQFAKLQKTSQNRVMEFMSKFRSNPLSPGLNYEKLASKYDQKLYSARVDDTYRVILAREEETGVFLLLWVDHHDEAYDWASKKRIAVNPDTGSLQVYDVVEAPPEEQKPAAPESKPAMFAFLSDADLKKLGVPEELIFLVRAIYTEKDLTNAQQTLPQDAFQALDFARDGCDLDEIVETIYGDEAGQGGTNIADALDKAVTKMQFTVVEGEEELKAAMNAPLEKWRVFLHPQQRKLAEKNFAGPAKVLGGAGTGKTVVAMHRARYLASGCKENERVLFTTFTANLAQDIKENLRKICSTDEMKKIEVIHLDAWISKFLKKQDYEYTICYEDEVIAELWKEAESHVGGEFDYPKGFFEEEWRTVVQAMGINTLQEYIQAQRIGRGVRLNRKDRIAVWNVFEEYRTLMNKKRIRDSAAAQNECCQLLNTQPDYHPYKHIIVDEGQDFGMGAYRLLRTLAGEQHENDLFIVGDAHQRIYKNKVVLSKCKVYVQGRSSRLRINYRTTEEIRDWAMHILTGIPYDDLDGALDSTKGYRSLTHGKAPIVESYSSINEEVDALIKHINELKETGMEYTEMCVVARTKNILSDYSKALQDAGFKTYEIKRDKTDDREMPGIRLATMHRVKGLEFTCVFIVAMNKGNMPFKTAIAKTDPDSLQDALVSERSLLYVALTRAKKITYVMGYGKMSEFVMA